MSDSPCPQNTAEMQKDVIFVVERFDETGETVLHHMCTTAAAAGAPAALSRVVALLPVYPCLPIMGEYVK